MYVHSFNKLLAKYLLIFNLFLIVAGWQMAGIISQVYPLHEAQALGKLQATWVRDVLAPQPLGILYTIICYKHIY